MNLKEAKEIVEELRGMDYLRNSVSVAAIILDDRIIELEKENQEIREFKGCNLWSRRKHWGG